MTYFLKITYSHKFLSYSFQLRILYLPLDGAIDRNPCDFLITNTEMYRYFFYQRLIVTFYKPRKTINMKQLFLIGIFTYFMIPIYSQHHLNISLNAFRPGDEIVKKQVSYKDPGRSGENVLWDFSRLDVNNEHYTLTYALNSDSLITGTEHHTKYYYSISNDSLLLWGYENPTTIMTNNQPELLMKFPVHYQDKTISYYTGKGRYCDRLSMETMGVIQNAADAYGMIILPNKDTLKHALRVKTVKWIAEETLPLSRKKHVDIAQDNIAPITTDSINYRLSNDSIIFGVKTFRWYVHGYRYPVFETVESVVKNKKHEEKHFHTAFFYPPEEHYYLDGDEQNLAILEEENNNILPPTNTDVPNPWQKVTYNCYPNPTVTNLNIDIYLPKQGQLRMKLTDRLGQILLEEKWGDQPEGIFTRQIPMGEYIRGEYVLSIYFNQSEYMISEKIIKL